MCRGCGGGDGGGTGVGGGGASFGCMAAVVLILLLPTTCRCGQRNKAPTRERFLSNWGGGRPEPHGPETRIYDKAMQTRNHVLNRLPLLLLFACFIFLERIYADTDDRSTACFSVVTARDKPLPPSAAKRMADATKQREAGAISNEQFEKKRRAITKDTPLVLLGYVEGKALALEVRRVDADERNWSTSRPPPSLRFDRPLRFPSS